MKHLSADCCRYAARRGEAICTSNIHNFARRKGQDEENQTAKPGKLETALTSPLTVRKLRRIGSKSRISSSDNLAALAEPGPPGSDSLDGVKRKRGGLGSLEAQAAVADADDDLARRVAQVELDAKAAEVAAPALATMDGSLHALPSKPAPGLDDMDGSLYNLRAFG